MKSFLICLVAGGLGFVFMAFQSGMFDDAAPADVGPQPAPAPASAATVPSKRARFPADLAPAARAQPVPQAAPFRADDKVYPLVFLKTTGKLVDDWQEKLVEGWAADTVEATQLVVVLGPHKRIFVDTIKYDHIKAPPITRYRYELEASVIEARTGKVLANQTFVNVPRPIQRVESWELTEIGSKVTFKTVFNWVAANARSGFPEPVGATPIVNVID